MLFFTAPDFLQAIPNKGVLMGFDIGAKTIGLAISDSQWVVVSPVETMYRQRWRHDADKLKKHWEKEHVKGFVVGWPLHMNGAEGPRCHSIKHIAQNMLSLYPVPCLLWDERLSTQEAKHLLNREATLKGVHKKRALDCVAASLILEDAIKALRQSD